MAEFHRNRITGLRPECAECCRAYNRAYYEAHREEQRAYNRAYREAHRGEISDSERAYREAHREECNAQHRKRKTEARKASREVATRNGEPWTAVEDQVLLTAEGTVLDIAIELGRTTSSVYSRRNLLRRKAVVA